MSLYIKINEVIQFSNTLTGPTCICRHQLDAEITLQDVEGKLFQQLFFPR